MISDFCKNLESEKEYNLFLIPINNFESTNPALH